MTIYSIYYSILEPARILSRKMHTFSVWVSDIMKVALHYNADDPTLGGYYCLPIYDRVFRAVLSFPRTDVDTDIFVGDVKLWRLKQAALKQWLNKGEQRLNRLYKGLDFIKSHNVFAVVFKSIKENLAQYLDKSLRNDEAYIGIIEVDDNTPIHKLIYTAVLIPYARIVGKDFFLFWDGFLDDSKDKSMLEFFRNLPFNHVNFAPRRMDF